MTRSAGHNRARLSADQRTAKLDTLFALLVAAARGSRPCPTLVELSRLLELNAIAVQGLLDTLKAQRRITWTIRYCGSGLGKVRIVTIVGQGIVTATPNYAHRPAVAARKHEKAERHELERAKTALRRFGRVVFDAEVTDGPGGRGLIKVDSKNMTPAEVLSLAQMTDRREAR